MTDDRSERGRALLRSGKLDVELEAVREEGRHAVFYAMLRGALLEINCQFKAKKVLVADKSGRPIREGGKTVIRQRKAGWAAHFYRKHFGVWPERAWEKIPPMRPNEEVSAAVRARDAQWRRMKNEERKAQEESGNVGRGVEDSETADALQQGDEGIGGVCDGGRVSGVEEQNDSLGELRETDE